MKLLFTIPIALSVLLPTRASAQEALFLTPQSFTLSSHKSSLHLSETVSTGPAVRAWTQFPVRWIFVKTGQVQENRDSLDEWTSTSGELQVPVPAPGPVMIGADFQPKIERVEAASIARFLTLTSRLSGKTDIRIRHFRSALTLFDTDWPGEESPASAIATTETSLTSSIHPLMDPTKFRMGSDMAFELVIRGKETEDARVFIVNLATQQTWVVNTSDGGLCQFRPDAPGIYEMKFQFAQPTVNDPEADYDFYSTTLTFAIKGTKEVQK